jgi:divalent metal cation (Fe/Co/Zn/Cd) transporter
MHLIVDAEDLTSAHKITERIETRLDRKFGPGRCTNNYEPMDYVKDGITYTGAHG